MDSHQNELRAELSAKAEQIKQQKQIAFWLDVCNMPPDLKDDYEKALQWAIEKQKHDDAKKDAWQNKYREYLTAIEENRKEGLLVAGLTQEEVDSGYVSFYTGNDPQLLAKEEAKRSAIQEVEKQCRFENEALNVIFGVAEEITPPTAKTGQNEGNGGKTLQSEVPRAVEKGEVRYSITSESASQITRWDKLKKCALNNRFVVILASIGIVAIFLVTLISNFKTLFEWTRYLINWLWP